MDQFEKMVKAHSQNFDTSLVFSTNALSGEVGELCNLTKKSKYYKHFPTYSERVDKEIAEGKRIPSIERLKDEIGDVLFYLTQTAQRAGITMEEVMAKQTAKLQAQSKTLVFKK